MRVVDAPQGLQFHYTSLDAAVDGLLEQLILPDDAQTRDELRSLLAQWLVERDAILVSPAEKSEPATRYGPGTYGVSRIILGE